MKSVQKKIVGLLKVLAMIVAGVLLGAILITLAYCIPVNQTNAQKSIDSLEGEGWYPSATQLKSSLDTYFHSYLPGVLDGATDGLMLEKATRQIEGNPLWEANYFLNFNQTAKQLFSVGPHRRVDCIIYNKKRDFMYCRNFG